ncbi:hypothetical protein QQ045_019733 [Rhodiola kirilowii]
MGGFGISSIPLSPLSFESALETSDEQGDGILADEAKSNGGDEVLGGGDGVRPVYGGGREEGLIDFMHIISDAFLKMLKYGRA